MRGTPALPALAIAASFQTSTPAYGTIPDNSISWSDVVSAKHLPADPAGLAPGFCCVLETPHVEVMGRGLTKEEATTHAMNLLAQWRSLAQAAGAVAASSTR